MKRRALATLTLIALIGVGGCTPYERAHLADEIMSFERDPISGGYLHHVHEAREGASGAGCN